MGITLFEVTLLKTAMKFAREKTRKVIVEENYVIDMTIVGRGVKLSIQLLKKTVK